MQRYSLWLVADPAEPPGSGTPIDLQAHTAAQAVAESRSIWMEHLAPGLRVYENQGGGLVYELRAGASVQ